MTRLETLRAKIPSGVDALLITNEITQRYLTEFEYTDGYVLVSENNAILLCDFRYIEAAKAATNKDYEVRMFKGSRKDWMSALLCELGIKTLAFEDVTLPCAELEALKSDLAGVEFVPMALLLTICANIRMRARSKRSLPLSALQSKRSSTFLATSIPTAPKSTSHLSSNSLCVLTEPTEFPSRPLPFREAHPPCLTASPVPASLKRASSPWITAHSIRDTARI